MKFTVLSPLLVAAALVAGCKTTDHHAATPAAAAASAPASVFDTSALVTAFKNADIPSNQLVQSVISDLSKKNYSGALTSLQTLARTPGLTAPQETSVRGLTSALASRAK